MEIEIQANIFNGNNFRNLQLIIRLATYKNRYEIIADLSQIVNSTLYNGLDQEDKEFLQANFNKQILEQDVSASKSIKSAIYSISNNPIEDEEFSLDEALRFFMEPAGIILENSLNDAHFVNAIIKYFDNAGEIKKQIENGWIRIENAGGCSNIENYINGRLQSFDSLTKENKYYLRCFVLLDSDRTNPTLPINYKPVELEKFLVRNKVRYHILEKRSMENYMPDEVFDEFKNGVLDDWIDAYKYLNAKQKDYLNISVGFSNKNADGSPKIVRESLEDEVKKLYLDVSENNYNLLNGGFKLRHFKSTFPAKFITSHNVHKKTLVDRTSHQQNPKELEVILEKIYDLI